MNSTANRQKIRFTILPGKITKMSKAKKVPSRYLKSEESTGWPPQIIVNKVASPGDADQRVAARARAAVAYLTVQIAATLRFGARDKVTAQIVISVTSKCDLRETFAEVPARDNAADTDADR